MNSLDEKLNTFSKTEQSAPTGLVKLSVVIPLFNEQNNIRPLFECLHHVCQELVDIDVECILVDDGSMDDTFSKASEISRGNSQIKLIRLARNYGSHAAIAAGLSFAQGDCALFMAGDLQDPPTLIPAMLAQWRSGYKIVWAARTLVNKQSIKDRFFSQCYWNLFNFVVLYSVPAGGVDFALIDKLVVDAIRQQAHSRAPIFSQIADTGFPYAVVRYEKNARAEGHSGWTLPKKLALVFQTLLISIKPIRVLSAFASLCCLISLLAVCLAQSMVLWDASLFVAIAGGHLFFLALVEILLLLAEHMNLPLRWMENSPRFVVQQPPEPNRPSA